MVKIEEIFNITFFIITILTLIKVNVKYRLSTTNSGNAQHEGNEMIHYRVQTETLNPTIYRSFKRASSFAKRQNGSVIAYADKLSAELHYNPLMVEIEPKGILKTHIRAFVQQMKEMKSKHPSYMNAADRRKAEAMYDTVLLGFDTLGRAIDAKLICDISCRWNRSKAPIFINGKKSNVKGLTKFIKNKPCN